MTVTDLTVTPKEIRFDLACLAYEATLGKDRNAVTRRVEKLIDMSDEEFDAVVNEELRGEAGATTQAALRHPAVLEGWQDALKEIRLRMDAQQRRKAHQRRTGKLTEERYLEWQAAAHRFGRALNERRTQVSELGRALAWQVNNAPLPDQLRATREEALRAQRRQRCKRISKEDPMSPLAAKTRAMYRLKCAHREEYVRILREEFEARGLPWEERDFLPDGGDPGLAEVLPWETP